MTETVTDVVQGRLVVLSAEDTECVPSITYRLNGGAEVKTGRSTLTLTISRSDSLEYWASDLSGNISAHKTVGALAVPTLKLSVSPSVMTYPSIVTLVATYSSSETTVVAFEVRYESDPTWYPIASASSAGRFVMLHIPPKKAYYRAKVGTLESAVSAPAAVSARMSKPVSSTSKIRTKALVRFSGTIRPKHPAGVPAADTTYKVRFWKYNARTRKWVETGTRSWNIESVLDNDTSLWSFARTFVSGEVGLWRVAFYHSCPRHAAKTSPYLQFSVVR